MFKVNNRILTILPRNTIIQRFKHKENHWSVQKKHKTGTTRALEHFDEFYSPTYKKSWINIRKALLGKQKYVAVINNYSDSDSSMKFLESKGGLNVRTVFELEKGHLQDEHSKRDRQRSLQQAWDSENTEMSTPVPKKEHTIDNMSLSHGLENAQLDLSRFIDGTNSNSILYEFVPANRIKGRDDFIPEPQYEDVRTMRNSREQAGGDFIRVSADSIHFPTHLNAYCFEEENMNEFPQPRRGSTKVLNYYLLDGASLLPVLALDLQPGSRMLDMCAAPGGKSLLAVQTLLPAFVQCNDVSFSRTNRIFSVMKQYLYDLQERWLDAGKMRISQQDACAMQLQQAEGFDRVLVDVPCTTDRHSAKEDDNNIFRPDRTKERLQLPELQVALLMQALRIVQVGGVVVYSTCSLSPIQNEGVVYRALQKLWEEAEIRVTIKDLGRSLAQFRNIYHFSSPAVTKYGHLVVPSVFQNYGPMYFCKLQRIQ